MKLYNTLTREKEPFAPMEKNTVRMYSCGPTVYNFAHIGNLRTYIFMDMLRRVLKEEGYKIKGVMNITDVGHLLSDADEGEDKMEKAARERQKTPAELADFYTAVFFEDLKKLNIGKPELIAKATDHIPEMISFVEGLIEKGYAYRTSDAVYFDIERFPQYGALSRADIEEQLAGARVDVNDEKHHPADFALWKDAPKEHIMKWESPWGLGFPGWHIECSAMGRKYLGDRFDIHTGGVDHIPIHHENEIAQSQALTGIQPAAFWMHGEFMLVDGGKMSKKLGNTYTVAQLEEMGYPPMVFRFFCLNAHYRKKLNFTFEALSAARTSYERLLDVLYRHKVSTVKTPVETIAKYMDEFKFAISDDINIPMALGVLFTMIKEEKSVDIYRAALEMDKVFGLSLNAAAPAPEKVEQRETSLTEEVKVLLEKRKAARTGKDYALSDVLRDELAALGYAVKDTKEGMELTKILK